MDWLKPDWTERLKELLLKYHGKIDAEISVRYIIPGLTSGNL